MGEVLVDFNQDRLATLPDEILVEVFSFLDAKDLYSMSLLGRYWHNLSEEDTLWKRLTLSCYSKGKIDSILKKQQQQQQVSPPGSPTAPQKDNDRATGTGRWKSLYAARLQTRKNWKTGHHTVSLLEKKHSAAIFTLAVNDRLMASGSSDQSIQMWDTESGAHVGTLKGHQFAVWCLKWLHKQNVLMSASYDSTIKFWNPETAEPIRNLTGHSSAIWGLDSCENRIASGSTDTYLRVWDVETGKCMNKIAGKQDTIWCTDFIDYNTVVTGGMDVRVWDLRACPSIDATATAPTTGRYGPVSILEGHSDAVRCIQGDDNAIVTGSYDSSAAIYDRVAAKKLYNLKDHTDSVTTLQFDTNGTLITSSFDHTFVAWSMATGAKITSWGHDAKDKRLAKDAKCSRLYINEPQLHGGKVYSLFFDETRLVSGREDGRIAIHDFS